MIIICLFFLLSEVLAQNTGNEIVGTWLTEKEDGIVNIYKRDQKYYGKLVWLKNPNDDNGNPTADKHNRDKALRSRRLMGILILDSFVYNNEDKEWTNGKVYDPNMGHQAEGILTLVSNDVLKVKGYVGFRWISKSEIWKRTAKQTP